MMTTNKLYMVLIGCTPKGRFTEQHDIFFGIGNSLKELVPHMKAFWPEAKGKIHIDAWREVTAVDNFSISIESKNTSTTKDQLFFINLGGYKENEFEEYHYKTLAVAESLGLASKKAKKIHSTDILALRERPHILTINTELMWMIFLTLMMP